MKALHTLQTVMKVLRILALIGCIALIIGIGGSLIGGVTMLLLSGVDAEFMNTFLVETGAKSAAALGCALLAEAVYLFVSLLVMYASYRYLTNEIKDGTPFTYHGAEELFRLSMLYLFVPLGGLIVFSIITALTGAGGIIQNEYSATVGLMCLLSSVACKYGAYLRTGEDR